MIPGVRSPAGPRGQAPRASSAGRAVAAAALAVGGAIWWPVLAPPEVRATPAPRTPWARDLALARLAERPLFNPARRFPAAPVEAGAGPVEVAARSISATHRVKGVARTRDDAITLIEDGETRRTVVLRVGGVVEGFTITGIGQGEVVLRGPDGASMTLRRSDP